MLKKFNTVQKSWAMYDWANSAYNLVITSTIFPAYYIAITGGASNAEISFFNWRIPNSTLLEYSLAFAYFIIAILSPILSSIADSRGNKKSYMKFYTYLGAIACMSLYFFKPNMVEWGIIMSMLAAVGYCGSIVFYNAYLPEIASPNIQDKLSALGFTYGYIGSVILQLICFAFIFYPFADSTFAPRLSFLFVGIWWVVFAQISFRNLPRNTKSNTTKIALTTGYIELKKVWQQANQIPILKSYLGAFFFYSMGVQTVMLAATIFGSKEVRKLYNGQWVNLTAEDLIPIILVIQLVAIVGATLMAKLSFKFGNFKVLSFTVLGWILICIAAYFTYTNIEFYILAVCVGLLMGGIQSLSRSTYSKLLPKDTLDTTSFFSFYDIMEKMSIVLGMFSFAFIEHIMSSMRNAIISLILFFAIGFVLMVLTIHKNNRLKINS